MARFCGNCGAQLSDGAKVCGQCGTPVEDDAKSLTVKIIDPEKKKKNKRVLKLVIAVVAVIAIAAIAITVIFNFTGYNGLLRKVMNAYKEYDIDTLVSLSSDLYYYAEEDYVEDYFKNSVGMTLDSFEASVGHNYKFLYKANEVYTLSDRKMSEMLDNIENSYPDFDVTSIEKVVVANLTITAQQDSATSSLDVDVILSKENGEWKVLYLE